MINSAERTKDPRSRQQYLDRLGRLAARLSNEKDLAMSVFSIQLQALSSQQEFQRAVSEFQEGNWAQALNIPSAEESRVQDLAEREENLLLHWKEEDWESFRVSGDDDWIQEESGEEMLEQWTRQIAGCRAKQLPVQGDEDLRAATEEFFARAM